MSEPEAPDVTVEGLQLGITQLCINLYNKLLELGNSPTVALNAIKGFLRKTADILEMDEE